MAAALGPACAEAATAALEANPVVALGTRVRGEADSVCAGVAPAGLRTQVRGEADSACAEIAIAGLRHGAESAGTAGAALEAVAMCVVFAFL